jgi:predicted NACHT family NTPase
VPFLVTLREYAAKDPPERSVVDHIEHTLETLYQCRAPARLVHRLLSTKRAIVIFDGLDELLDTSRRKDVTTRVERFCAEYPLAPVLVTSRIVGYDQARLDDEQFTCYRLSGFGDDQVAEYVRKWFALEQGARTGDAEAFLAESANVPDLRSNPLLLSLMCILYRGAGSLPRNRAEIYEERAELLLRKWDARRRIHCDLRADCLVRRPSPQSLNAS